MEELLEAIENHDVPTTRRLATEKTELVTTVVPPALSKKFESCQPDFTPLHFAVAEAADACVEAMCNACGPDVVNVATADGRTTPLLLAAQLDDARQIVLLLSFNADPLAVDKDGNTCFHFCLGNASDRALKLLLTGSANATASDFRRAILQTGNGNTPLGMALETENFTAVRMILDALKERVGKIKEPSAKGAEAVHGNPMASLALGSGPLRKVTRKELEELHSQSASIAAELLEFGYYLPHEAQSLAVCITRGNVPLLAILVANRHRKDLLEAACDGVRLVFLACKVGNAPALALMAKQHDAAAVLQALTTKKGKEPMTPLEAAVAGNHEALLGAITGADKAVAAARAAIAQRGNAEEAETPLKRGDEDTGSEPLGSDSEAEDIRREARKLRASRAERQKQPTSWTSIFIYSIMFLSMITPLVTYVLPDPVPKPLRRMRSKANKKGTK